jgi:hypothetical protein
VRDDRWIRVAGAVLVVAAIVFVGWSLRGLIFPGDRAIPVFATPTPTPAGTEFDRADIFWNRQAIPALVEFIKTVPAINTKCKTNLLAAGCHAAILASDQKLEQAVTVINQGDVPACLTTDLTRFKGDVLSMDGGLQISLNGYKAGDKNMVLQGLSQFHDAALTFGPDSTAVTNDVKVLCN